MCCTGDFPFIKGIFIYHFCFISAFLHYRQQMPDTTSIVINFAACKF